MGLFTSKKQVEALKAKKAKLKSKSDGLVNQFKSTADGLVEANEELSAVENEILDVVTKLETEAKEIAETKKRNQKVANNILQIIES